MSDDTAKAARDEGAAEPPFARDFGYLDKFLAAVVAHAESVAGPRGARLRELLAGETGRFAEVRALLSGAEPESRGPDASLASGPEVGETNGTNATQSPRPVDASPHPSGLTVGSLLGDRRRASH